MKHVLLLNDSQTKKKSDVMLTACAHTENIETVETKQLGHLNENTELHVIIVG